MYHVTIGLKACGGIFLPFGLRDRNGGGLLGCHQGTGGITSCLGEEGDLVYVLSYEGLLLDFEVEMKSDFISIE